MNPIRVFLVEDHDLVRAGFISLLQAIPEIEVVAEAKNGREALDELESAHPDIILLDLELPDVNGLELIPRIIQILPLSKILILSMYKNEEYVIRALRNGAHGYLVKDSTFQEFSRAIDTVLNSEIYLSSQVSQKVLEDYIHHSVKTFSRTSSMDNLLEKSLTRRQNEILRLIAEGKTTKEISRILQISPKTVETHKAKLMDRLQIFDIAGLVKYAIRLGLLIS
jgi:DNA-binding NarL/FixJ family response regulator